MVLTPVSKPRLQHDQPDGGHQYLAQYLWAPGTIEPDAAESRAVSVDYGGGAEWRFKPAPHGGAGIPWDAGQTRQTDGALLHRAPYSPR